MRAHVEDWIPEFLLGNLDDATRAMVESHVGWCKRCAEEVVAMGDALSTLALSLPIHPPHPTARTRLLAAVVEEEQQLEKRVPRGRFAAFLDRLADFFDVSRGRAGALIELLDDPSAWIRSPMPGIELLHVQAGPRFSPSDAGFLRMAPGTHFPYHRHIGTEYGLILEGGLIDDVNQMTIRAGECHNLEAGTSHDFSAFPDDGCLFAAVVVGGIEIIPPPKR